MRGIEKWGQDLGSISSCNSGERIGDRQDMKTARTGLIMGARLDELHHDLIERLKSKHRISVVSTFDEGSKAQFLSPRMFSLSSLLIKKYDIVIVLSGYRLTVSDFLRRLLALLVRAHARKVCRPSGKEGELSWGLWFRSLPKYFLLSQKVHVAKLLAYGLPILCFFALRSSSKFRKE